MTMDEPRNDPRMDALIEALREGYNTPPETPRDEMWQVVRAGLAGATGAEVVDLEARRRRRFGPRVVAGWAAAAAALVVLGVGIGRMTAPDGEPAAVAHEIAPADGVVMRAAALEHLGATESLLRWVRAEGRAGRLDPEVGAWARGLLTQTRLFLDAGVTTDPAIVELMEDLELVLAQIVGVTEGTMDDGVRRRTELDLALRGLEDREVLTRIQAMSGSGLAGT